MRPEPYLTPKNLASRGGPAAGGGLSLLGALLAMIGFLLPWASCAGTPYSGLELAQQPGPSGENLGLLYLVPFLALGCLGLALSVIPLSAWRRIPVLIGWLGLALVGVLGVVAAVPLILLYTSFAAAQKEIESSLGIFSGLAGDAVKIEPGYWLTAFGLALVVLGAIVGCAVGIIGAIIPKRPVN
jgi:hypothetical protein